MTKNPLSVRKSWLLLSLVLLAFLYLIVLQLKAVWPFTLDDMYISLRYARHWSEGKGLLWNLGEAPVEGYSNFSFVALAALALNLGFDPIIVLKATGALGLVLTTIALYCLSRLWFSSFLALIPCLWMLLYGGQILWSVSGLETSLYQALICFSLLCLLRGMGYRFYPETRSEPNLVFFILAGLLLALAGLTRPEAPALMLLFAGLALFDSPKKEKGLYFKGLALGCLSCLLLFLPYFLWRWNYYGRLFPNPVYCKALSGAYGLLDKSYIKLAWPFFLLSFLAVIRMKDRRHFFLWLPSCLYLVLLIGTDPVSAFINRLFLPVFILLLPLALWGLASLCESFLPKKDEVYLAALLMSSFLVAFFFIPMMSLSGYRYFTHNPRAGIELRDGVLTWLEKNAKPGSKVILADSGQVPYLSRFNFIDSYCLNNKAMTIPPTASMYERLCATVLVEKPEIIILTSLLIKGDVIYTPADLCLYEKLKTNKDYRLKATYQKRLREFSYRYEIYGLIN